MHYSTLAVAVAVVFALICIILILLTESVYIPLHRWIKVLWFRVTAPRSPLLILRCAYCSKELTEPEMYAFRGWVGCEHCVRDYYRDRPAQDMESELRTRQSLARAWLTSNRKVLAKSMTRSKVA